MEFAEVFATRKGRLVKVPLAEPQIGSEALIWTELVLWVKNEDYFVPLPRHLRFDDDDEGPFPGRMKAWAVTIGYLTPEGKVMRIRTTLLIDEVHDLIQGSKLVPFQGPLPPKDYQDQLRAQIKADQDLDRT